MGYVIDNGAPTVSYTEYGSGTVVTAETEPDSPLGLLQRSGIVYTIGGPIGQPMIDEPNPFSILKGLDHHTLYLDQRITLTYRVLMGCHYDFQLSGGGRKGLVDILLFPLLARVLLAQAYAPNRYCFVRFLAGAPGFILEFARHVVGVLLTGAMLPVAVLAHIVMAIANCCRRQPPVRASAVSTVLAQPRAGSLQPVDPNTPDLELGSEPEPEKPTNH